MIYDKNILKDAVKEHYENLARENVSVNGEAAKITTSIGYAAEALAGILLYCVKSRWQKWQGIRT